MSRARYLGIIPSIFVLIALSLTLGGCKAQQQMQKQLQDQDERIMTMERRLKDIDNDLRSTRMDESQLRSQVKILDQSVASLLRVEEERKHEADEAKAKAAAAAAAKTVKKPLPPKKKHK